MKTVEIISDQSIEKTEKIRLAAYCRVSTEKTDQLNSFIAQIKYYSDYAKKNTQYELVDIYADEGLTGTDMKKRNEFNRLLNDCKKRKIDRVITKSTSRFTRNTQDFLIVIRMLKEIGVSVYFEEQGIDTGRKNVMAQKVVRYIAPTITAQSDPKKQYQQERVAAYCRVSTKQDEQLNSYEVQKQYYTEKIRTEPKWCLAGIYADKGITGTSTKNRDAFNKMIRDCKRGKIDRIITKSISRFARNTVDCLKYVRLLKELNIDIYFEEQGIHSIDPGAEFYITIYGSIAQSESENISANVRWGKDQSAKEGKVVFKYKNFLGYRKGEDGKPEIVPEEAETVKLIYDEFLKGNSLGNIANDLTSRKILTPSKKEKWTSSTIRSILSNEKYIGDAVINKTYVVDCISKKVKSNNGERPKYYVENNHPAIIDRNTFNQVQEELARRVSMQKVKFVGTKTQQGKYSSKYALTGLLICGECGTPYRRCTWTMRDKNKKIVWRCINRLDYGKKYCNRV